MPDEHNYRVHERPAAIPRRSHIDDFRPRHHAAQVRHETPPPMANHSAHPPKSPLPELVPSPVVKMWSTRGLEYAMMTISLWFGAVGLVWILLDLVNNHRTFDSLAAPTSILAVSVPILTLFFLRLKRAEIRQPLLRADPSRRRWTQLTQFLSYLVVIVNLIGLVYSLLSHYGNGNLSYVPSVGKTLVNSAIILAVSGLLLIYFWRDEHLPLEK